MQDLCQRGLLRATEEVLHELERKDDEVFAWAKAQQGLFVPIDNPIQGVVSAILQAHRKLLDTRKNRSGADPFVIALAKIQGSAVVTDEHPTGSLGRPNIPDVCEQMGIRCVNFVQLMREQRWVFRAP